MTHGQDTTGPSVSRTSRSVTETRSLYGPSGGRGEGSCLDLTGSLSWECDRGTGKRSQTSRSDPDNTTRPVTQEGLFLGWNCSGSSFRPHTTRGGVGPEGDRYRRTRVDLRSPPTFSWVLEGHPPSTPPLDPHPWLGKVRWGNRDLTEYLYRVRPDIPNQVLCKRVRTRDLLLHQECVKTQTYFLDCSSVTLDGGDPSEVVVQGRTQ